MGSELKKMFSVPLLLIVMGVVAAPAMVEAQKGPNGEECPDGEAWYEHEPYVEIEGKSVLVSGGCGPEGWVLHPNGWLTPPGWVITPDGKALPPLDLGTTTVFGQRIRRVPIPWPLRPAPRPVHTPPPPSRPPPPRPVSRSRSTPKAMWYSFGKCSRSLGGEYRSGLTQEEQQRIANSLSRHDDVKWGKGTESPSAGLFPRHESTDESAGFFAVKFKLAARLNRVDGEVRTTSPLSSACAQNGIDEAKYIRVAQKVATDRANPPKYHLLLYNCQRWAADIEALTL